MVADDRREDTDFNYWLHVVGLSDASPLLLIQNEKQDRRRDIDLVRLRGRFPNLKDSFRTNLADNRGLAEVRKAIQGYLESLPLVGTPLPKTWKRVRAALERDPRNYISVEEYERICRPKGFERRKDMLQLSGYLHDLGVCLHFQDDPVLKKTVLLKPKWAVDAVYRVLDDRKVQECQGEFTREDLARIWHEEEYASVRDELLRLMQKLQLCYTLSEQEGYIAPQLLPAERPEQPWKKQGNLVVRYRYDFMPKGIATRFIVAAHDLIAQQDLAWRSGVVLERDGTRARVVEDYPRNRISVRLAGPDTRGLFAIVDRELEHIHASFPKLRYDRYLPCSCHLCRNREDPYSYSLSELKDFAHSSHGIQCRVSKELVDAAELIRDVLPSALRDRHGVPVLDEKERQLSTEQEVRKEVFVSYAWGGESGRIVDELETSFAGQDIALLRDRNEIGYRDSIREFMKRLGSGKCVIVVLSEKYLKSDNCMFELVEIAKREDMRSRIFPIILEDAKIYDTLARMRYIKHWMAKKKELEECIREVGAENLPATREDIDLYARIRATLDGILGILKDMNALTPETHRGTRFDTLVEGVQARLSE